MNGYSEASIVCGGNIGDPGFYLYLAKVKQKLQKILKTDREDLLIEKVERWNSVRVTFRLPPSSADILRSLVVQRPDSLRDLGIQSVQVDAGQLITLGGTAARSADSSASIGPTVQSPSASGLNWNQAQVDRSTLANAAAGGNLPSNVGGGNSGLLLALVEASNSSGDDVDNGQRKRSIAGQTQHPQSSMALKTHQQPPGSSVQQQQNLLGYLLEEPDQPTPPAPPPYQDYHQQQQPAGMATSTPVPPHLQQQRWQHPQQQQQQQQQQRSNAVVVAWNHHAPPSHASTNAAAPGQTMSDYYYHGHQQQQGPPPSTAMPQQHHQYANTATGTSAMHSRQQQETAAAMAYSSGTNNSNPVYRNINYGHQQLQPNPGNVSNSPLLVGLLQQNSPPPQQQQQPSSSFMHPPSTPLLRNNSTGNLSGYNNELVADSSPPAWLPVAANQGPIEPAAKKQKRGSATAKPKKAPNSAKGSTAKKNASKRAGATVATDGNSSSNPAATASSSYTPAVDQELNNQQQEQASSASSAAAESSSSSSFNRDTSISSVIDSVLCNVAMGAAANDSSSTTTESITASKARQSLDSPTVAAKSTPSSGGPVPGPADETASQCSPMSATSVSTTAQHHQHLPNATGSPVQNPQQRQQQSVLRSVSSSSSSSSPLVASASPTFEAQWHQRPGGVTVGPSGGGVPSYGAYQNQPNHQFVRHHLYQQHPEGDLGVGRIRRPVMVRQPPPRFAQTPQVGNRFAAYSGLANAPGHSYPPPAPPQTTYDLAHHDNASRMDNNAYSNAAKTRSPAVATVNGDMYLSPTHPTAAAVPRHPMYHGQQNPQQEQYGASSSWSTGGGVDGGNGNNGPSAETAAYMISSKTPATATTSGYGASGGADHDYLVPSSMESGGAASSFPSFPSDQQQPPVANDYYGFTSTASQQQQQHPVYNYSSVTSRAGGGAPMFYNGGGGEGQQMQEALVARQGSAYDPQQSHSTTHWDKQQQRVARHRQSWSLHPGQQQSFERHGGAGSDGVYDDDSVMRDMTGSVGSSPLGGFPSGVPPHQSMISTGSSQQHLHNHGLAVQQQQQATAIEDPMLSGQVPAR